MPTCQSLAIINFFRRSFTSLFTIICTLWARINNSLAYLAQSAEKYWTKKDAVIVKGGTISVVRRCIIAHTLPICASPTLAGLNLKGFFIGDEYLGYSDSTSQAIDRLSLQVTAKLFVSTMLYSWNEP